jgi:hypothetical protein
MNIFVPGTGNPYAKILFIGEAPSFEEENALKPFVGPAGRLFDECLKNASIDRNACWITNVFKQMIVPQQKFGRKIPAIVRAEQAGVKGVEAEYFEGVLTVRCQKCKKHVTAIAVASRRDGFQ